LFEQSCGKIIAVNSKHNMGLKDPIGFLDELINAIGCGGSVDSSQLSVGGAGDQPICTPAKRDLTNILLKWKGKLQQNSSKVHPVESDTQFQDLDHDAVRKIVDYLQGADVARLMCTNSAIYKAIKEKKGQYENKQELKIKALTNIASYLIDWFRADKKSWDAVIDLGGTCELILYKTSENGAMELAIREKGDWCTVNDPILKLSKRQQIKTKDLDHSLRLALQEDTGKMLTVEIYHENIQNHDLIKIDPCISSLIDFYNKTLLCITERTTQDSCSALKDVMTGGNKRRKIFILGRERVLHKRGRKWMLTFKRQQISLTEARALDKRLFHVNPGHA
jgi:hypothetical protein